MKPLVFQSDFGLVDGAVSAMYGVAYSVNPDLKMHDLTQVETGLSDGTLVELRTSFPEGTTFYYRYADSIEYRFER